MPRRPENQHYIYFVKANDLIKIGCSTFPLDRLKAVSEWVPFKLELLATMHGSFELEADIHAYFAEDWNHGEWFHYTPRLQALVAAIKNGIPVTIPKVKRVGGKEGWKTEKKRASHRLTAIEKALWPDLDYCDRLLRRPQYVIDAVESYRGPHKPPPTPEALAAIERYAQSKPRLVEGRAA